MIRQEHYKIDKDTKCHNWKLYKNKHGYGRLTHNKKCLYAHRVSYEINKGRIPNGLYVLHSCDNPSCINPNHLWLGTQKDNLQDMAKKGRHIGNRKITRTIVNKIRKLYSTNNYKQKDLVKLFSLTKQHVHDIVTNKKWKDD